jgi:hypothetical protein
MGVFMFPLGKMILCTEDLSKCKFIKLFFTTPLSLNKLISRVALNQTFSNLAKFIEKYNNIYDTK